MKTVAKGNERTTVSESFRDNCSTVRYFQVVVIKGKDGQAAATFSAQPEGRRPAIWMSHAFDLSKMNRQEFIVEMSHANIKVVPNKGKDGQAAVTISSQPAG